MTNKEIMEMIKAHEGYSETVYLDTEGVSTGGYGHAFIVGSKIPHKVASELFWHDVHQAIGDYGTLGLELDPVRRGVLIDMLFNLGITKLRKFVRFLSALRAGDYDDASLEMMDSKWAGQVKGRAVKLAEMMRTGEI